MAVGGDPPSVASAATTGDGTSGGSTSASSRSGSGGRRSKSGSPQKSSSSIASKRSTMTGSTEVDVAAMRHLRSIVAAIATDENLPPVDRSKKMADFEQLLEKAEKRLHFNENKLNGDPLGLLNPPEVVPKTNKGSSKKRRGWLKARLRGMRQRQNLAPTVDPTPAVAKDQNMRFGGALETLEEERGDAEEERGNDRNPAGGSKRVSVPNDRVKPEAEARKEEVPATTKEEAEEKEVVDEKVEEVDDIEDDDTAGTATDSILQMRMMNSEEYTASVGSIRSLSTFEKDFVKNVIAEQQVEEDRSVSTFEQDFMAREARGGNIAFPTQVFTTGDNALNENEDDLTADATVLSETTFEQDARNASPPKGTLPMQITTSSNRTGANEGETDDDDITLDLDDVQSETTFEADQRQRAQARKEEAVTQAGSAPTTMAIFDQFANTVREVRSDETKGSVSTYMKDAQALKVLAAKIGRTPSTKSKARSVAEDIVKNGTETSTNTFEKDYIAREMMMEGAASDGKRGGGGIGMASPPAANFFVPKGPVMARFPSENSTGTFEKDMNVRRPQRPQLSQVVEASGRAADGRLLAPLAVVAGMPHPGGGVPNAVLSPSSTAAMAQHQMQPTPQQHMSPPQQLRPTPSPSPMSVSTVYGPSYAGASRIGSPPSQTAFENDTVRSSSKTGAASSHSGRGLGSISVGTTSLGGFERDARAGMKNVGTVYPMNHVPNAGAGHGGGPASSVASAYDSGALMAHGRGGPGAASAIDLSVAAQRELTAQVDAKRAAAALPKISPLVMELSPNAIDKGVKLRDREGTLWSKFMCWTGS